MPANDPSPIGARPRVLVTDAQDLPGLAAIRSLHAAGFAVSATAIRRLAPGAWSRACSDCVGLPDPGLDVRGYVAALREHARAGDFNVLVAGTDETLYAVSRYREQLTDHVALGLPPHAVVQRALDKACLGDAARAAGLASPESHVCHTSAGARDAARAIGFPVLVKPIAVISERDGRLIRHPGRLVVDEEALHAAHLEIGPCIVQRQERGTMMAFAGVSGEHGLAASVLYRYRRLWPVHAGNGTFSETVAVPADLRERVEALVVAIGWKGVFQLELMETANGTIKAIDFNPRLYGSLALANAAGVPLAALWCASILGGEGEPVTGRVGIAYRWEDGDARNIAWQLRNGAYGDALRAMLPQRRTAHGYFQARDPLPLMIRCAELANVRGHGVSRRALQLRRHKAMAEGPVAGRAIE